MIDANPSTCWGDCACNRPAAITNVTSLGNILSPHPRGRYVPQYRAGRRARRYILRVIHLVIQRDHLAGVYFDRTGVTAVADRSVIGEHDPLGFVPRPA